jgi:hypothetical protein
MLPSASRILLIKALREPKEPFKFRPEEAETSLRKK